MRSNRLFLGDDLHRHIGGDVRHQTNGDDVFAGRLDGAERRANLRLLDLEAELVHRFSDVGVGDGAEQTAVDAALAGDRNFSAVELAGEFFGGSRSRGSRQNASRRGENVMARLELTFEEAAFGCEKEVAAQRIENCPNCKGTGSADGVIETCSQCHGTGQVRSVQNFMGMQMQSTTTCPTCGGRGKVIKNPCTTCRGKGKVRKTNRVKVKIPAGVDAGQSVRVRGEGCVGVGGGPNGDLLVEISIRRHPIFTRNGTDVLCEVPITFTQAALGATIQVPTLDGKVDYEIPEGTQTGREFILREKGIPEVGNTRRRGNERFTVVVETPTRLTKEQKDLLRQLDGSVDQSPKRKKFLNNLKDFFG